MQRRREPADATVISVTSAQPGHSVDLESRIVRYAWMMSLRVACFVLAVFTPSPWRWMFVAGAVFLPSVAVVLANVHQGRKLAGAEAYAPPPKPQLDHRPGTVVPGEYESDQGQRGDTEK